MRWNQKISLFNIQLDLLIILLISVVSRVLIAIWMGNQVQTLPGIFDQVSYHNLALRFIDGHGFTFGETWWPLTGADEPTAHWSYLYTFYLVVVYSLFGEYPLIGRLIQAVFVGIVHTLFAYKLGEMLFGRTIALIAAAWTAVYVYFAYYSAALMTEPVYITMILASFYFALRLSNREAANPNRLAIYLGLALAITVLLRQLFVIFLPILCLWIWYAGGLKRFWQLVMITLIVLAAVLPFTYFNYTRFDQFVLINTNAGFAFFWGNHPIHGTNFIPILTSDEYTALIPGELWTLNEADLEDALMERGLAFITEDPVRYMWLSLSRIPTYFMFWPSSESSLMSNISRVISFGMMLPFALLGLWQSFRSFRFDFRQPIVLVWLFMFFYTGIHLMSWVLIRYRLPVDAFLVMFAAVGALQVIRWLPIKNNPNYELPTNAPSNL